MHMTLEYDDFSSGTVPTKLHMKLQGHDGPFPAEVAWRGDARPMRVDDRTLLLSCDVRINGTSGMAAFVMHGGKVTSIETDTGKPVEIRSARFSENREHAGFAADGLPGTFVPRGPDGESMPEYLCRKGIFVGDRRLFGALHALPIDDDVSSDGIESFLERHPGPCFGTFAAAVVAVDGKKPAWTRCYLYALPEHAEKDLAAWKARDIAEKEA